MCPVCISTLALVAGSATSAGGVTALILKKFGPKNIANKVTTQTQLKENNHGH